MTYDEMLYGIEEFLNDVYPGVKGMPTELVSLMTSNDPKKALENKAVLHPEEEVECDPLIATEFLDNLNKQLDNNICPSSFQMIGNLGCIHSSEKKMTYSEATDYCTRQANSQLLHLETVEDVDVLKKNNMIGIL